jgi:Set1/Ash2 histone methyltransferase complex subunit ASH2
MSSKRRVEEPINSPDAVGQGLSTIFKDRRLRVSEDRMTVTGDKSTGYQTVLAEYSASQGDWYFEVSVEDLPEDSHVRIGWSTRRTRFDQPLGSDCFSYAVRDIDAARVTLAKRWSYGNTTLKAGDVVGCSLRLPSSPYSPKMEDPMTFLPNLLCDPETVGDPDLLSDESSISFSVNGKSFGVAFTNCVAGEYYPAVSIFGKAKVKFNFGPHFAFLDQGARPACEMYVPKELMRPKRRPANFIPRGLTSGA